MKFLLFLIIVTYCSEISASLYNDGASRTIKYEGPLMAQSDKFSQKYIRKPTSNLSITIPVIIHLDSSIAKHIIKTYKLKTREKAKLMFRKILKTVQKLFLLPKLYQMVNFSLLDVKILKNSTKSFTKDENVSKYLKSYCMWQSEKKISKKKRYYSILFTGLDLFYLDRNKTEVRTSTGRGYMGGVCSIRNSCTVLEWHKENVAYILAHELAHSLGVSHEGPANKRCVNTGKNIMSAKYNPKNPAKSWSMCNKWELDNFLASKKASCILYKDVRPVLNERN